jgi:hypothetical protein
MFGGRYVNLLRKLDDLAARTTNFVYLEVGTFNGVRAANLLDYFLSYGANRTASYIGFDLFEDMTPDMSKAEFSKSTLPLSTDEVQRVFANALGKKYDGRFKGAQLFKGNTQETLKAWKENSASIKPNFIFIDGGHSLETIASDFKNLEHLIATENTFLMDDYYVNRMDFGCRPLVEQINREGKYVGLPLMPIDHIPKNDLDIQVVTVYPA